jgi:hypothetical protein
MFFISKGSGLGIKIHVAMPNDKVERKKERKKVVCTVEYNILGCNVVYFGKRPTFRRNMSPPSSGSKSKPIKETSRSNWKAQLLALLTLHH